MIIYKTINLINGKKYIGQDSKNNPNYLGSGDFLKKAIQKYGKENFKKEIIEYCDSLEELNEREIYWLNYYNVSNDSLFYNCININRGSRKGRKVSFESKIKMSNAKKGIKHSLESINNRKKPILQYDLQGNFIKEWKGIIDISRELKINGIEQCCKYKRKTCGKFIWRYKNDPLNLTKEEIKNYLIKKDKGISKPLNNLWKKNISKSLKGRKCNWNTWESRLKIIEQYDLKGNFIKEWENVDKIYNSNILLFKNKSNIRCCCRGKTNKAYGFKWKYKTN